MTCYVSLDMESDGLIPGVHSMVALGAVAFDRTGRYLASYYDTYPQLPWGKTDPNTMSWWRTQDPAVMAEAFSARTPIGPGMAEFVAWVKGLPDKPLAVAWPAAFDFAWVNYYTHMFAGGNPLGYRCADIRSFGMGLYRTRSLTEHDLWDTTPRRRTQHNALADAWDQGELFCRLLRHTRAHPMIPGSSYRLLQPQQTS